MQTRFLCLILTASALLPHPVAAQQASFDCRKASTPAERTICKDARLRALDAKIAQVYAAKVKQLPPAAGKVLNDTQRYFLNIRDQRFDYARSMPDQTSSPKETLQERLDQLGQVSIKTAQGYTGTWADPAGAWSIRKRKDGRYDVTANSVEPVAARGVCNVSGIAKETPDGLVLRTSDDSDADVYLIGREGNVLSAELRNRDGKSEQSCGIAATLQGQFLFTTLDPAKELDQQP